MADTRKRRIGAFLFSLLAFGFFLLFLRQTEKASCLDVEILTWQEQEALGTYAYRDVGRELLYNGQPAAVDVDTSTVYIPQDIHLGTATADLLGSLQTGDPSLQLSFAPDEAFEDLAAAVQQGHEFALNVELDSGTYMQYNVVFTTLPVLRIEGAYSHENEQFRAVYAGRMCLWNPMDPDTGRYSVKTGNLEWHIRGGWSSRMEKTPFKLNLKKKNGTNQNLSLVGLGADDDWILNPMNLDDTKLKEKLFIDLWNRRAGQVDWNEPMSRGEYVEVVIDQSYQGVYQLQRRIDGKFLNLDDRATLLKGSEDWEVPSVYTSYEIVHSGLPEEEMYGLLQEYLSGNNTGILDLDNFLDVNLFLQWASAEDNAGYKNMFYLLREEDTGYRMTLLPWDTDMAWGTIWGGNGFVYDFDTSLNRAILRMEYGRMQSFHADLDQQMARRWFQLREDLLTLENMTVILEREQQVLNASGAQNRDLERWGLYYGGEDSLENLYRALEARLAWVDAYYSQYLQ